MSATIVVRLDAAAGRRLREALGREAFAFRPQAHARFSARGEGVTVTLYDSGKLVVQGADAEAFAQRFLEGAAQSTGGGRAAPAAAEDVTGPSIGSDESGKGDYFGPLVVAAALVRPDDLPFLRELGVADSKGVSDGKIRRAEGALRDRLPHAVESLDPETYNAAYQETPNINKLLGRLHAQALEAVLALAGDDAEDAAIVVDRFGDEAHVRRNLGEAARALPFRMEPRAESHPAVAAASFLARAVFLEGFERLRGDAGGELLLGASDPRIVPLAARLLEEGGETWLGHFAKLHFRVTAKARARR